MSTPVAVIGAGPYGLSTAAHLRARGLPVRVFGQPMASWRTQMPAGMLLKSTPAASSIDAPQTGHTLADFCAATGEGPYASDWDILPIETFVRYGQWVQQRLVPGSGAGQGRLGRPAGRRFRAEAGQRGSSSARGR